MNSLRPIINSKIFSHLSSSTIYTCRFRQKSTSTTTTNKTSSSQSHTESTISARNENTTVWNVYGPPFVNCFLIGSITYIGLHVIWYKLALIELQEEMENKISELENKIDFLKKKSEIN
jgi:hypothetical protein